MLFAPVFLSALLNTVAPVALLASWGDHDREKVARGAVQLTVTAMRSAMEVTYDDIVFDDRSGDFSLRGLQITLPDAVGVTGCTVTFDVVKVVVFDRPDTLSFGMEADGIDVLPVCAGAQSAVLRSMLGPDATKIRHYSSTLNYSIGQSALDYAMVLETEAAGAVSANLRMKGLHFSLGVYGDPHPAGEITSVDVTFQDTEAVRVLLPILGPDADPVAMATGAMGGALSDSGLSDDELALIDSARTELGRLVEEGGAVTVRSGRGVSVSFESLQRINRPDELVTLFKPVFSAALAGADGLIPSGLLKAALNTPGDLSTAEALRVAAALASGDGVPRSPANAASLLKPLAENGNSAAALQYASLLFDKGDTAAAYGFALAAGQGGASGARTLLDRIESGLSVTELLGLQDKAAGEQSVPPADISVLRREARRYASGLGVSRHYATAFFLATLAAAGGDDSSAQLAERLLHHFDKDDDAQAWRKVADAHSAKALFLWADGFGDSFGPQ